jgi:hypothetical protein
MGAFLVEGLILIRPPLVSCCRRVCYSVSSEVLIDELQILS